MIGKFLKWFFIPSGVMYAEEQKPAGRSLRRGLARLFTGAVRYGQPDAQTLTASYSIHRPLKRYRCRVCHVWFWSWRRRDVCWRWSCYKQS